jgi:hypothetical protein
MPHQAVVLWKSVVQQLQRLATLTPQQQQVAAARKVEDQLNLLVALGSPLPRAVWKQLINDVQVGTTGTPFVLCCCCCRHGMHAPHAWV